MNNTTFAVIAVVSALALFGVVMVTEAIGCTSGAAPSTAFNASKGRCLRAQ